MPVRILIAEDNPTVRTALRMLLEGAGSFEIIVAENGQETVAKAQELKPNLIILDLVMPVMDGLKRPDKSPNCARYSSPDAHHALFSAGGSGGPKSWHP